MKFILSCSVCIVRQITQVSDILGLDEAASERLLRKVLDALSKADYSKSTPMLMGKIWDVIEAETGIRDVYKEKKLALDDAVLSFLPRMQAEVDVAQEPFEKFCKAMVFAVCGNLIDFAASGTVKAEDILEKAAVLQQKPFRVDFRKMLFDRLGTAETLLYLGDNCGEIATDRLFIENLRRLFPRLKITFVVKAQAVLNDVTIEDADAVNMSQVAAVITNGGKAAGTELSEASEEFRAAYENSDVVICKGQGNYESLMPVDRTDIFFLMMAKCPVIAEKFKVDVMSLICSKEGLGADQFPED